MFNIFKKKPTPPAGGLQTSQFPKGSYTAYWEKLVHQDQYGKPQQNLGIVRFYAYGGSLLTFSTFEAENVEQLEAKMDQFIMIQMEQYKR